MKRAIKLSENALGDISPSHIASWGTDNAITKAVGSYLSEGPLIDYLDEDEQPNYFFYNETRGFTAKGDIIFSFWDPYRSAMWVTNKGIYFTKGSEEGDTVERVQHDEITEVEVSDKEFVFQTERGKCKFYAQSDSNIEAAKTYIEIRSGTVTVLTREFSEKFEKQFAELNADNGTCNLQKLQKMDEYEFEHLVATTWEKMGFDTEVTPASSDRGVDVEAKRDTPFQERHLIQAKRFSGDNKVGSADMQKYSGLKARNEQVDQVVVVTTTGFTSEAKEVASARDVKTVNGRELLDLVEDEQEVSV